MARPHSGVPSPSVPPVDATIEDLFADTVRAAGRPWFDVTHSDFGAVGNGTTDDDDAILAAIEAAEAVQGRVVFPKTDAYYKINEPLPVTASMTLDLNGARIHQAKADTAGFHVTADDVTFLYPHLTSTAYASAGTGTTAAIKAIGTSASDPLTNLRIVRPRISSWQHYGIYLEYVEDFDILLPDIRNIWYAAILGLSVADGTILVPRIDNIVGTPLAYGIAMTRREVDSLVTDPRSRDVDVIAPHVTNVTNWEGLDTHAGERIRFLSPRVRNCQAAVVITNCDGTAGTAKYAPLDCVVDDYDLDSGVTDGSAAHGIGFSGAYEAGAVVEYATGRIGDGTIRGYGEEANAGGIGAAILVETTDQLAVGNPVIWEPGQYGLNIYHDNRNIKTGIVTVVDPWSDTLTVPAGIATRGDNNTGIIGGLLVERGDKDATYVLELGLRLSGSSGIDIEMGPHDLRDATTAISGGANLKLGFNGVDPITRPAALTQTYATADRTHAARTAAALTDNSGGTSAENTVAAIPNPADTPASADALRDDLVTNVLPAIKNAIATLVDAVNGLQADQVDTAQFVNAVADDLQSFGLEQ